MTITDEQLKDTLENDPDLLYDRDYVDNLLNDIQDDKVIDYVMTGSIPTVGRGVSTLPLYRRVLILIKAIVVSAWRWGNTR